MTTSHRLTAIFLALAILGGCKRSTPQEPIQPEAPSAPVADGPPLFEDITAASGIDFTYRNGEDTADHLSILESLGGGAGLIDYDGDGLLDVFLPGGGGFAGKDKKDIIGFPCKLYQNLGKGKFKDVTAAAGLDKLAGGKPWFYSHGVAVADYDCDGWPDLLVTGWKRVVLFHNVAIDPKNPAAGRRFEDVTAAAGLGAGIDWATSAAFGDLDGDGFPDLYICQYVDWSWEKNPKCSYDGKIPDVCPPRHFDGLQHKIYRNSGQGKFIDATKEAGLSGGGNASKGMGVLIVDVDGDGKPDIYVANDTVDNFLYLNQSQRGQLRLKEVGLISGVARDDRGGANGSMGVDVGDPERLGKPCLWVTNYENELHALYRNDCIAGRPFFHFRTSAVGIAAIGHRFVGWGTAFVDADLDGWQDLFVANGHAIRFPLGKDAHRRQRPVLLRNLQGRFVDISPRLGAYGAKLHLGRGVAFGDLDNDGRIDMVINHMNEPAAVLRGVGGQDHHWLGLELSAEKHACLVGTKVEVEAGDQLQTRFAKGGGSYASAHDGRFIFGLGTQQKPRVRVTWPDGSVHQLDAPAVDRYHRVVKGVVQP